MFVVEGAVNVTLVMGVSQCSHSKGCSVQKGVPIFSQQDIPAAVKPGDLDHFSGT